MIKKVFKFGAEWCSQCKELKPIFEKVSKDLAADDIVFVDIDVDDDDSMLELFNIMQLPTVVVAEEGKTERVKVGVMTEQELIDFINAEQED